LSNIVFEVVYFFYFTIKMVKGQNLCSLNHKSYSHRIIIPNSVLLTENKNYDRVYHHVHA